MVVPSTEKAKGEDIPVYVKAAEMSEDNLRVWVSNKDYQSLLIDNQTASWNVVQNNSKESIVVETTVRSGYHVISSCNANSKLLVILNKELYAAYDFNTDIFMKSARLKCSLILVFNLHFELLLLEHLSTQPKYVVNYHQIVSNLWQKGFAHEDGWEEPVLTNCYTPEDAAEEIERIANTTVTEQNVDEVASDLALVTTQTEDLDVSEVEDVAESLDEIANADSSSPDVTNILNLSQ
ncbi:putative G-protein coupled receptor [Apostichopus japonicus]|uniref:Putative G-protein coupled receptor n=1 Tax=Stichopus japonicus TaxID=307972 RepID=A0A2G8LG36_STIJA|nr:putative G-protein coupled receptor [Apostichopus japonicus]